MISDKERERILTSDTDVITAAIEEAVARAIEEHRRLGFPIAVWRDGKVVWIPPEDIPPYEPPSKKAR